jgi:hypothetical protein
MSKSQSVTVRFTEAELGRLLALPRHPADRSESDRIRRMLAERAEQRAAGRPPASRVQRTVTVPPRPGAQTRPAPAPRPARSRVPPSQAAAAAGRATLARATGGAPRPSQSELGAFTRALQEAGAVQRRSTKGRREPVWHLAQRGL